MAKKCVCENQPALTFYDGEIRRGRFVDRLDVERFTFFLSGPIESQTRD